jgi:hypothetical protein
MLQKKLTKAGLTALAITSAIAFSSASNAAITGFTDDFQGYGTAPTFAPWDGFSDNGGFPGGYGFAPSTGGPQISALANDGAGNEYMNFYANYDNGNVHDRVNCNPCSPNTQEAISIFRNFAFDGTDTAAGDTWTFTFDYATNPGFGPAGATEVGAFIRVFDGAYNLLATDTLNTNTTSAEFLNGELSVTLNSAWTGGFFQVGFNNLVGNYDSSGMFYDNACLSNDGSCGAPPVPVPAAVWLFGSGLLGLVGVARRRKA